MTTQSEKSGREVSDVLGDHSISLTAPLVALHSLALFYQQGSLVLQHPLPHLMPQSLPLHFVLSEFLLKLQVRVENAPTHEHALSELEEICSKKQ